MTSQNRFMWTSHLLASLDQVGEAGRDAAKYLRDHRTYIGFRRVRRNIGAFWTILGTIHFNTMHYSLESDPSDLRVLTLLIHEVKHLQQGILTALSVYGELEAWQLQFRIYHQMTNAKMHIAIEEMMSLSRGWDRAELARARELMQEYAGKGYRADLLPLYPLGHEIRYRLFRQVPT
jgi:hypothetical protein